MKYVRTLAVNLTLLLCFSAREPRLNECAHNKIVLFANSISGARRLLLEIHILISIAEI